MPGRARLYHLRGGGKRGVTDQAFYEEHGGSASWRELHATIVDSTEYASLRDATYGGNALAQPDGIVKRATELPG